MGDWVNKNTAGDGSKLELAVDETFEGTYLGSGPVTGVNGVFTSHSLQGESGAVYYIAGASLNNQLSDVEAGSLVRLTYKGKQPTKTPGREVKVFEVAVYVEDPSAVAVQPVETIVGLVHPTAPVAAPVARSF